MLTRRQLLQMIVIIPSAIVLSKTVKTKAQSCQNCLPLSLQHLERITIIEDRDCIDVPCTPGDLYPAPTNIDLKSFEGKSYSLIDEIRGLFIK